MIIKDIVNRDLVNLTNCEHEPIHIPGSTQPHGLLLAVRKDTFTIEFCGGNIISFLGVTHEQVLSKTLTEVLGEIVSGKVIERLAIRKDSLESPLDLTISQIDFSVIIHESGRFVILEFEYKEKDTLSVEAYYNQTRSFVAYMEKSSTLQSLCQGVADETRAITGYDRVMIYRFDKDYNGEVFAESKREDIESYLGVHYPHTDIPAQARELYKQNLLRVIVDINYTPVPIYTIDDEIGKNLDLSHAVLRSVSPIHVQYLQNIGVGATLTISLMHHGDLWGLIACHHYSPKYISYFTRVSAQLQGHFLASQIRVREVAEQHEFSLKVNSSLDKMLSKTQLPDRNALSDIISQGELLSLCNASGVALLLDNEIFMNGATPERNDIHELSDFLKLEHKRSMFHTSKLADIYPKASTVANMAGVIFYSFDADPDICLIWFRAETITEVNWAGDPTKAIIKDEKGLSPRKSFELWKEVIKFQSGEWNDAELTAASYYGQTLERNLISLFVSEEETKSRLLNEKLRRINEELENVNWIGTHDLKEPLRKIQIFASILLNENQDQISEEAGILVGKIGTSANRMQHLITDILSYSKLFTVEETMVRIDLTEIVRDVISELSFEINEKSAQLVLLNLPVVNGSAFLLRQLFTNLIGNSLKFAKDTGPSLISVGHGDTAPDGFMEVYVQDNGIGFDTVYKEKIFNVFTRLHAQGLYRGSGIGLALCRKIMDNHNGLITADGQPGEGAKFSLFFPTYTVKA